MTPLYQLAVALQFFTRIPMPRDLNPTQADLARVHVWLPIVGVIVGGASAATYVATLTAGLPAPITLLAAMTVAVLLTGAFHEDGLADTCDGLGGGWTREDKLRIMRDSRVGTYGALGLVGLAGWRFGALWSIESATIPLAIVCGHVVGRWSIVPQLMIMPYAREAETGERKPVIAGISSLDAMLATVATLIIVGLTGGVTGLLAVPAAAVVIMLACCGLRRQLGGVTGDTLGAVNVVCEITTYVTFAAMIPS